MVGRWNNDLERAMMGTAKEEGLQFEAKQVARLCHNLNKDYCWLIGDFSQPSWDNAPEWQIASAVAGVEFRLANPGVTPEQMHENWMKQKVEDGWVYGPVKDPDRKSHPCIIPYSQLPASQRLKDYLFSGVVDAMRSADALGGA